MCHPEGSRRWEVFEIIHDTSDYCLPACEVGFLRQIHVKQHIVTCQMTVICVPGVLISP